MRTRTVCGVLCTLFLCVFALDINDLDDDPEYDVIIETSNLPVSLQVGAAKALKTAYELETNSYMRMRVFTDLVFNTVYDDWAWMAVLDCDEIYFNAEYYMRLKINDEHVILISAAFGW